MVMTGPGATHRIACFNPPTGRGTRSPASRCGPASWPHRAPPGTIDEVGGGRHLGSTEDLEGIVAGIQGEEGLINLAPAPAGLPLPLEPEHHTDGFLHDD